MSKLNEAELNQIMMRLAKLPVSKELSAEKIPALEEGSKTQTQTLLEGMRNVTREILTEIDEQEKLNEISYRLAGLKR